VTGPRQKNNNNNNNHTITQSHKHMHTRKDKLGGHRQNTHTDVRTHCVVAGDHTQQAVDLCR